MIGKRRAVATPPAMLTDRAYRLRALVDAEYERGREAETERTEL